MVRSLQVAILQYLLLLTKGGCRQSRLMGSELVHACNIKFTSATKFYVLVPVGAREFSAHDCIGTCTQS